MGKHDTEAKKIGRKYAGTVAYEFRKTGSKRALKKLQRHYHEYRDAWSTELSRPLDNDLPRAKRMYDAILKKSANRFRPYVMSFQKKRGKAFDSFFFACLWNTVKSLRAQRDSRRNFPRGK